MLMSALRNLLYEPRVKDVAVDDPALLALHSAVLQEKVLLRSAFETFYRDMMSLCEQHFPVQGIQIELGSGAGFFQNLCPGLVTSDIRQGPGIDMELDALRMQLADSSVRCLYAINVFHHLPEPDLFLAELGRVLVPGGGCILIEPHVGFASALLHRHMHKDEHFDPAAKGWVTAAIAGPLSGANQALAHIVFERDRQQFEQQYGATLEIVEQRYELNALRYLCSGGLNFRQLLPGFMVTPLAGLERTLAPLARHWSLHQATVLRRRR